MKTLEQIKDDVGIDIFTRWEKQAEAHLKASRFAYRTADARHAFTFEEIQRRYEIYKKVITLKIVQGAFYK